MLNSNGATKHTNQLIQKQTDTNQSASKNNKQRRQKPPSQIFTNFQKEMNDGLAQGANS